MWRPVVLLALALACVAAAAPGGGVATAPLPTPTQQAPLEDYGAANASTSVVVVSSSPIPKPPVASSTAAPKPPTLSSAKPEPPAPSSASPKPPAPSSVAPKPPAPSSAVPKPSASPKPNTLGKIEHGIIAGGWIPFVVVLVVAAFSSVSFVRFYQHKRERETGTTVIAIIGLVVALLTSAIIPVDVYLVSTFKDDAGIYHGWASQDIRDGVGETVTYGYFALYALICLFAFFLIPWGYFFFEEKDEDAGTTTGRRLVSSLKYAVGLLVVMAILMCIGAFAISSHGTQCDTTIHEDKKNVQCKAQYAESALASDNGTNAISFTIGFLSLIGATYFILYTAVGLVLMPIDMIRFRGRASREDRESADEALRASKMKQSAIRQKYANKRKKMSSRDRDRLAQEEEDERVINVATRRLDAAEGGMCAKLTTLCTPFKLVFGIAFLLLSFFLVISLCITSLDKLLQIQRHEGLDYKTGYTEAKPKIFNPVDLAFTYMQKVFPVDYVFMTLVVFFFVACTLSGVRHLGIRMCGLKLYDIRPQRTTPQGILLLTSILMFTVLFLNVFLLSLAPQYVTYGNQHFPGVGAPEKDGCHHVTTNGGWSKNLTLCSAQAPANLYYIQKEGATKFTQVALDSVYNASTPNHCGLASLNTCESGVIDLSGYACYKVEPACTSTRMAALLHAFFYNLWFFGAIYFWANWGVIVAFFVWFVVITCRRRRSIVQSLVNDAQDDFDDSDDDMTPFNPSWRK